MQLVQHYLGIGDILVWSRIKAILEGKAKNSYVFLKWEILIQFNGMVARVPRHNNGKFGIELKEKNYLAARESKYTWWSTAGC